MKWLEGGAISMTMIEGWSFYRHGGNEINVGVTLEEGR